MTDQSSEDNETSEVDRAVRALLGQARVDEPMPADVADRIDAALGDAASEGLRAVGKADARRRVVRMRTRMAGGLVAAAVLVVGAGVGIAQLHTSGGSDSSASGSSADTAGGSVATEGNGPSTLSQLPAGTPKAAAPQASPLKSRAGLPALRSTSFAADVRQLVGATPFATRAKRRPTDSLNLAHGRADCTPPPGVGARADIREISLDGSLAILLIDPPSAQPRRATAYSCEGGHELASTELSH